MSARQLPVLAPGEAVVIVPAHRLAGLTQTASGVDVHLVVDERLAVAMVNAVAAEGATP